MFIHSVSGKVMEQDLSDHAPLSPDTPTDRTHNATTTNSVAMDITLDGMESSIPCDPNMFSDFGQVSVTINTLCLFCVGICCIKIELLVACTGIHVHVQCVYSKEAYISVW